MSFIPKIYALLFALCINYTSFAQTKELKKTDFKFKNYTIFDGLPSTSITSITQDEKGFMWFGTRDGLSRFDGFTFTNFSKDDSDPNSLSHNQVQIVFVDNNGMLWVGTKKGLNKYIEGIGFKKYYNDFEDMFSLSGNLVHSICEDKKGNIWVGTNNGINVLDQEKDQFKTYTHNPKNTNSLSSNFVKEVFADSQGFLWIITDSGIDRFDLETKNFKHYHLSQARESMRVVNFASVILEDKKGKLWIGNKFGLWFYNQYTDTFIKYDGSDDRLKNISVRAIQEDDKGNFWIGAYSGLYIDNQKNNTTQHITHNELDPSSLSSNSIHSIYQDTAGNLWLGTWAGGINYLNKSLDFFKHYGVNNGLSYPVVSDFTEDEKNNLWVATEGGGINYFNRSENTFTAYKHDPNNSKSIAANNVHGLARSKEGELFIATFGKGMDYYDPKNTSEGFTHFKHDPKDQNSISSNYILSIQIDSKGRIWVGTSNAGLNEFNPDTKKFTRYSDGDYALGPVHTVYENNKKQILIGSQNGLGMVDLAKHVVNYDPYKKLNDLIDEYIVCIYQDTKENYWIGTEGDGLIFMNNSGAEVIQYQTSDGLPNNVVYGIIPDDLGNLWLSTHNGLSKFNVIEKTFENFNVHDGLQSNEFNFDAYAVTEKGEFIFGGVNGFNLFDPSQIKENKNVQPVIFTDFKINEQTVPVGTKNSPLSKPISQTKEIVLNHDQSIFSFEFISLDFAQPGKNSYAYKLEGFSEDWLNIGNRKHVTFTNIHPGDYTFKVKTLNKTSNKNNEIAAIDIKILPPAYLSWWAYLLYFVLAGLLIITIWTYIKLRAKDKNELKKQKLEREKNDELHQLKLQFFTNISHELRTPLTLISGPVENLLSEKDKFSEKQQKEIDLIGKNAKSLLRHVNRILDFRKDENAKLKLKAAKGNFVKFAKETSLSFTQIAETRNIDYQFKGDLEEKKIYFDRDKMEMVIYNLLSNAFKFTPDSGKIMLAIKKVAQGGNDFMQLCVSDNGKGIDSEDLPHVFERFYQVEKELSDTKGSGIGLAFTKRLVELHHGEIEVQSAVGKGTVFTVKLPIGKAHLSENEIYKEFKNGEDPSSYKTEELNPLTTEEESIPIEMVKEKLPILLIVEDNDDVRYFIKTCFENDFNIYEAANGKKGLEMAKQIVPDIIISDVMMPEMDGIAMCAKVKKDISTSHIPVVLLTARTSLIFKKTGLETGADDYINKPFTPSILKLKVQNILDSKKKLQEYFIRNYKIKPTEVIMTSKDDEFINKAIKCVEDHISDSEFNVTVFVNEMGMSRSVLFRKLKGITGQSTTEFIRTIRVKRAAQILLQGQMSISETAYDVGFNDLKYFRTCFRKQFGTSPSQYIAQNTNNDEAVKSEN